MLKIEIVKAEHLRKEIPKAGVVYEQKAYVFLNDEPYPKEIRVSQWVDKETGSIPEPYPKGVYTISPESFSVGKYADLVCRPRLIAVNPK